LALLALAGLTGSTAAAQATDPAAQARALAGSIVEQYAPGTLDKLPPGILSGAPLSGTTFSNTNFAGTNLSGLSATAPLAADPAAAAASRQRAQAFLNQYAPGMVTLGAQGGVRVATPAAVVDTRPGATATAVAPASDGRSMLHRLATTEATTALRADDLAKAERWIDAVAAERSKDPDVRQLQSLVLFRAARYADAADAAKSALRAGEPWDRTRLSELFPNPSSYDASYTALREEAGKSDADGKLLFLLAYHERMLGRADEARHLLDAASARLPEGWIPAIVRERFEE
jgi:hypothetical protein